MGVGRTVTRADRSRRIDDDRGEAVADHAFDEPLGGDLAALIGPDRLLFGERHRLVRGRAVVTELKGRDARRVDDALGANGACRLHHHARPLQISPHDLIRAGRPQPVVGCHVKNVARALRRSENRTLVAHVALDDLNREPVEIDTGTGGPEQSPNAEACAHDLSRHGGSDKAASSGNERGILVRHGELHRPPGQGGGARCYCGA